MEVKKEYIRKHYYKKCQKLFRVIKIDSSCRSFVLKHNDMYAYSPESWKRFYIMFEWFILNKSSYNFKSVYIDCMCLYPYICRFYAVDQDNEFWSCKFCKFDDCLVKIEQAPYGVVKTKWYIERNKI